MSDVADSSPARRKPRKLRRANGESIDEGYPEERPTSSPRPDERDNSELTALPSVDSSVLDDSQPSFRHQNMDAPSEGDELDERHLRRHFADVESSFLPDVIPGVSQEGRMGVDDTYLELGKPGRTPPPDQMFGSLRRSKKKSVSQSREVAPVDTQQDEYSQEMEEEEEHSPTSPAVAAAKRTHARTASAASTAFANTRPSSKGSTVRPTSSRAHEYVAEPDSDNVSFLKQPTEQPMYESQSSDNQRPSLQNNREDSRYSMQSSTTLSSDLSMSDVAANADFALSTGGAVSGNTMNKHSRASRMLARLPSYGSVGSNPEAEDDSLPSMSNQPGFSPQKNRFGGIYSGFDEDRPETPRAKNPGLQAPTDTVLAQRVDAIRVPDTVARDFFANARSFPPDKRPASSTGAGLSFQDQSRKTLTLKEQNSKIDKLAKENFDLKLKIHFLDQALQSRSADGVKELIDKNVQLQTDLANERKESQSLRRKMRELERKVKQQEEADSRKRNQYEDDDNEHMLQGELHEEILHLRQQLDYSENQVTTLREENMTRELEKRKMAEHMRNTASRGKDTAGMKETMDMWQDLLNAETGRREQAEEDIRKLRDELTGLRIERASSGMSRDSSKMSRRQPRHGYSQSAVEGAGSDFTNGASTATTLVVDQLKHENAELRRDLGAQTSMLTSRNRERERLQQEIEDLKLLQRKSDGGARSVAGESIFERSISRAHNRAPSRNTERMSIADTERDDWETREGDLRDQNSELRMKYQELERTHTTHLEYVSALEGDFQEMEQELNEAAEDLRALQTERDEALHAFEDKESEYQKLEQEALAEIDKLVKDVEALEAELDESQKQLHKTQTKLEHTSDGYKGLQGELRDITNSVMNLDDEKQSHMRNIQTLEQQIAEAEDEISKLEQKCADWDQKNRKLEITQESLSSEVTFLREEQEGDKIKIGELENALNATQQLVEDEQEKLKELNEGIIEERQQREGLATQSKEEIQKVLDGLNAESAKTRDDMRKLRRELSAKEVEASTWKQRHDEFEEGLRSTLGDRNGTKSSLFAEIERVQMDLESMAGHLDRAKMDVADKDRLLRHRDGLLENTSLESRRLSDLLDKERSSRKRDLDSFEKNSHGQASHMRKIAQQESRILELETGFSQDKRKMAAQEQAFYDQLGERNSLLLALWYRLSTICGTAWAQDHSLVNGEVPSVEVISRSLPAFNYNIISSVKMVESIFGNFKQRIRATEKELWRDYQTIEHNLELRMQRMDALEQAVHQTQTALAEAEEYDTAQRSQQSKSSPKHALKSIRSTEEMKSLKSEIKLLKAELKFHRQHPSAMAQQLIHQQNTQPGPEGIRRLSTTPSSSTTSKPSSPARMFTQLLRHHSSPNVEPYRTVPSNQLAEQSPPPPRPQPIMLSPPPPGQGDTRWVHRLKEMERRLKAEREARLLDRQGARQRIAEGREENEELRMKLQRERARHEGSGEGESVNVSEVEGSERWGTDRSVD